MTTAKFAGRGGVTTMIAPHATGHKWAKDGTLLRVDCERGIGWVATRYDLNLRVIEQVRGPDEEVHRVGLEGALRVHVVDMHRGIPEKEDTVGRRAGLPDMCG